jgi:formate-dependent nitrite reductase membrane component NrfD
MVRNRNRRAVIAGIAMVLWLGYMVIGLAVINTLMPTVGGEGPEGAAAFLGLIGGVFAMGFVMWWASD